VKSTNTLDNLRSRFDQADKITSNPECKFRENMQSEQFGERTKENNLTVCRKSEHET
jgi:hypothetical protein